MAATTAKLVLPKVDHKLWASDPAAAYQKWETLFLIFLADLAVKDVTADWTAIIDPVERIAHPSYPAPVNATKRKAHKACQIKVLLILTHVWQDYLPSILAKFKATHYDDPARREGDNPYCVATACYAAIQSYCKPRDSTTRNNNRALFEAALFNFPQYHGDLKPIETWASTAAMRWLDLSPPTLKASSSRKVQTTPAPTTHPAMSSNPTTIEGTTTGVHILLVSIDHHAARSQPQDPSAASAPMPSNDISSFDTHQVRSCSP